MIKSYSSFSELYCFIGNRLLQVAGIVKARWSVEVYHRELKQTCGIERCQARTGRAQRNHIGLAIATWFKQHRRRCLEKLTVYEQNWRVIKQAIAMRRQCLLNST